MTSSKILLLSIYAGLLGLSSCQNQPPTWNDESTAPLRNGIREDTQIGATVATLKCDDVDTDAGMIKYRRVSGDAFKVSQAGAVTLAFPLDFDVKVSSFGSDMVFSCVDIDKATFQELHTPVETRVQFAIDDANDNPPKFAVGASSKYEFEISEDLAVGTQLSPSITITDSDRTQNALLNALYFSCDSPNEKERNAFNASSVETCEKFTVTKTQIKEGNYQATISIKAPLDYESKPIYSTQIIAVDGPGLGIRHLSTTVALQINILDAQDQLPIFTNAGLSVNVPEDTPAGTTLSLAVSARDGDIGVGARRPVKIELIEDVNNVIQLDPAKKIQADSFIYESKVVLKKMLDKETLVQYPFVVKVIELDSATLAETTATATATYIIFATDINDNSPTFEKATYKVDVTEKIFDPLYKPVQIPSLQIVVNDADEGVNARYKISIVSQTFPGAYSVSPVLNFFTGKGNIFLQVDNPNYLDYDKPSYRNQVVVLEAKELVGKFSSSTTVSISVVDINDNKPVFPEGQPSTFSVSENVNTDPDPYKIAQFQATDIDSGDGGVIEYYLETGHSDSFGLDRESGELYLVKNVDFETKESYSFLLFTTDKGSPPQFSQILVTVNVINFNDQGPVFDLPLYQATAGESSLEFLTPVVIKATDNEAGTQGIMYRIISGQTADNAFLLNANTGKLSLRQYLDYDNTPNRQGFYELTVEASDGGNPPMTNVCQVKISVNDENNHDPVLKPKLITVTISEVTTPGKKIAQVTGTDEDGDKNGKLTYRLGPGSSGNFQVDPETGVISVSPTNSLDYDVTSSYSFKIVATDGGAPQRNDTAEIQVTLTDANNKPPTFDQFLFRATVREDDPMGKKVIKMEARDPDITAAIVYSLEDFSASDKNGNLLNLLDKKNYDYTKAFSIDQTGQIKIAGVLDKEIAQEISFVVIAKDDNSESGLQTATASIAIIIEGDPDTDIRFDPIPVSFMNEEEKNGYRVATVVANDPQNTPLTFSEVPPLSNYFRVTSQGQVEVDNRIDFETMRKEHQIIVKATATNDGRFATATVTVSINDINDNSPQFQKSSYEAEVSETAEFPTRVTTILATDKDSSSFGPIMYRIAGGLGSTDFTLFQREVDAVVLVATGAKLDFNNRREYKLDILAYDNPNLESSFSTLQKSSTVQLTIKVKDENNHSPDFKDDQRSYVVQETAVIGKVITNVEAFDKDFGDNGKITYSLEALPDDKDGEQALVLFKVDPRLGMIAVAGSLLGLGGRRYTFRVRARDRGEVPRTDFMLITMTVLSTEDDDGNPKWQKPAVGHVFYAPEEEVNIKVIDPVRDFDVDARTGELGVTFELSTSSEGYENFRMDPDGTLTIIKALDREIKEKYELLVYAKDNNDTVNLRTGRRLMIHVTDKNDNDASFYNPKGYAVCGSPADSPQIKFVTENTPVGTKLGKLNGCDPDSSEYNELIYTMYNGNDYCKQGNALSAVTVSEDGTMSVKSAIDYDVKAEYDICVQVDSKIPMSKRDKRSFNMKLVDTGATNIAYIEIDVIDANDNGPQFETDTATAVIQATSTSVMTGGSVSDRVLTFNAVDKDGKGKNIIQYYITKSVFYGQGKSNAVGINAFRVEGGALYKALNSYKQYSGGVFILTVRAIDALDSSMTDEQRVELYVYEQGQALKLVLNMPADQGYDMARPLITELNDVSSRYAVQYLSVSEHRSLTESNIDRTDICFMVADTKSRSAMTIPEVLQLFMGTSFNKVLTKDSYKYLLSGQCHASQSSEDDVKWKDLWWVLVAVAIFIFVCCLILMILAVVLYRGYKRYMKSKRIYLEPR